MKKNITLLFLITLFSAKGQTYVNGFINANTLWTLANSPYIINGNTLLSHGYTLKIEPGVTIKFDTNRTLQIDGELIAIGTSTQRIVFTSLQGVQNAGDWGKIQFQDTSIDAVFDNLGHYLSGSIMKYCDILWGGGIGFGAIQIQEASPYFTNCNILNSSSAGIYGVGSYIIDSSAIKYNNDFGICFFSECAIKVISDTFVGNQHGGILLGQTYCSQPLQSTIANNFFYLNNGHGAIYQTGGFSHLSILDNLFKNNTGSAVIGDDGQGRGLFYCLISCNQFIDNATVCLKPGSVLDLTVSQNFFQNNNRITDMPDLMNLFTFTKNLIYNCTSIQYLLNIRITNQPTQPFLLVHNNEFKGNTASALFHLTLVGNVNNSNHLVEIKYNNFLDTASTYVIQNDIPFGSYNIAADSNYWGTINTQHIDTVINDYFDNGNLSVVYYLPILTQPSEVDTACSSSFPAFVENYNSLSPNLFPNPFSTSAQIEFKRNLKNSTFTVYNLFGQKIKQIDMINEKNIFIYRDDMESGMYIYQFTENNNKIASGKFIVY